MGNRQKLGSISNCRILSPSPSCHFHSLTNASSPVSRLCPASSVLRLSAVSCLPPALSHLSLPQPCPIFFICSPSRPNHIVLSSRVNSKPNASGDITPHPYLSPPTKAARPSLPDFRLDLSIAAGACVCVRQWRLKVVGLHRRKVTHYNAMKICQARKP